MYEYCRIGNNINNEHEVDPITFEELKDKHPRYTMTIRRMNNKPYPYKVTTVMDLIKRNCKDPYTREEFSDIDKKRAKLYYQSLIEFPDYNIKDNDKLVKEWFDTYKLDKNKYILDSKNADKIRLKAKSFLQPEDLLNLFKAYDGKGSLNNRLYVEQELKKEGDWILRNCSIKDTDYEKAYVLSLINKYGDIQHILIIHYIGGGFYYGAYYFATGDSASKPMKGYINVYPTIIELLEDNLSLYH